MKHVLKVATPLFFAMLFGLANAQVAEESTRLAGSVKLADVHRHLQPWMTPEELLKEMNELNIGWVGGGGPVRDPIDVKPYIALLGSRYVAALGQLEFFTIYFDMGGKGLADPDHPEFKKLFASSEAQFLAKSAKGFGELIINNSSTAGFVFGRKVLANAPSFDRLFQIAAKHSVFMQIHSEADEESVASLVEMSGKYPTVPIILSHCLFTSKVDVIDAIFAKAPNLYCDLSARSELSFMGQKAQRWAIDNGMALYGEGFVRPEWVALIEKHPTRFMVGTDNYIRGINTKAMVTEIRKGLLPRLKVETISLVAYQNALRVMKIAQP